MKLKMLLAGTVLLAATGVAVAQTATDTFVVRATVVARCAVAAEDLDFGNYDAAAALDATTTVTVLCTNGTAYAVALDGGESGDMSSGSGLLAYNLFQDNAHTILWGDGAEGEELVGVGNGERQVATVYGRIELGQFVTPGVYIDTITTTITY